MLNVAMLSKWHVHAEGYAKEVTAGGRAKITAVWDESPERGTAWAARIGADFEPDLQKLLARPDVDAVVNDSPTTMHREVLVAAAQAKKHIFTEKAMAPTVADCEEIAAAVRKAGVKFVISMPHRCNPMYTLAKQMIEQGQLGKISVIRLRNAHSGSSDKWLPAYWYDESAAAGGSMMDLGCHPMYLSSYLLGKPKRISAVYNTLTEGNGPADDNSVATIEFGSGAVAIVESGFVTPYSPNYFEMFGTEGSFIAHEGGLRVISRNLDWAKDWAAPPALPEPLPSPINMFLNSCIDGTPSAFGLEEGIALTELLENSYISDREKRQVLIG